MARLSAAVVLAFGLVARSQDASGPLDPPEANADQLKYWARQWIARNPSFEQKYTGDMTEVAVGQYRCSDRGSGWAGKPFDVNIKFTKRLPMAAKHPETWTTKIHKVAVDYVAVPNFPVVPGWSVAATPTRPIWHTQDPSAPDVSIISWDGLTLEWEARDVKFFALSGEFASTVDGSPASTFQESLTQGGLVRGFRGSLTFRCHVQQRALFD